MDKEKLRWSALDKAIVAEAGNGFERILLAAKAFEAYLNGDAPVSNMKED